MPIDYDDYLDVLFYIGSKTPLHMNMMISFYILGISQLLMIYIYIYILVMLGMDPKAHV